jgi:hypothetical protein
MLRPEPLNVIGALGGRRGRRSEDTVEVSGGSVVFVSDDLGDLVAEDETNNDGEDNQG